MDVVASDIVTCDTTVEYCSGLRSTNQPNTKESGIGPQRIPNKGRSIAYPLNKDAINMEKGVVATVFCKRLRQG